MYIYICTYIYICMYVCSIYVATYLSNTILLDSLLAASINQPI